MGNQTGNQIPWSDPNYWSGWNNTAGSLGGAIGQWVDAFDGQQPIVYPSQNVQTQQSNTALYIGFGILALLLIIIIVFLFKKS